MNDEEIRLAKQKIKDLETARNNATKDTIRINIKRVPKSEKPIAIVPHNTKFHTSDVEFGIGLIKPKETLQSLHNKSLGYNLISGRDKENEQ